MGRKEVGTAVARDAAIEWPEAGVRPIRRSACQTRLETHDQVRETEMSRPNAGFRRQAWLTTSHWWGSNARDLAWMALLVSGAVLVAFLMR
jgi:hypothetical protein